MATFITVEQEGNPLLRRNKEQTQANRLNKVQRDQEVKDARSIWTARGRRPDGAGVLLDFEGNFVGWNFRRRRFRMDEPAATWRSSNDGVLFAFFYVDWISRTYWFEPTNRSSRTELLTDAIDASGDWYPYAYVLPAGESNTIVVFAKMGYSDRFFPRPELDWPALVVSATGIRQINAPEAFKQASVRSGATGANSLFYLFPNANDTDGAVISYAFDPDIPTPDLPPALDLQTWGYRMTGTPGIYSLLNYENAYSVVFENTTAWARSTFLVDAPVPSYGLSSCGQLSGRPCSVNGYRFYRTAGVPENKIFYDQPGFTPAGIPEIYFDVNNPLRPEPRRYATVSEPRGRLNPSYLITWDWGQPNYCRQQLLSLGFSISDLTP